MFTDCGTSHDLEAAVHPSHRLPDGLVAETLQEIDDELNLKRTERFTYALQHKSWDAQARLVWRRVLNRLLDNLEREYQRSDRVTREELGQSPEFKLHDHLQVNAEQITRWKSGELLASPTHLFQILVHCGLDAKGWSVMPDDCLVSEMDRKFVGYAAAIATAGDRLRSKSFAMPRTEIAPWQIAVLTTIAEDYQEWSRWVRKPVDEFTRLLETPEFNGKLESQLHTIRALLERAPLARTIAPSAMVSSAPCYLCAVLLIADTCNRFDELWEKLVQESLD